jgi:hypothetical protein
MTDHDWPPDADDDDRPWHARPDAGEPQPWLVSATDLLVSWMPDQVARDGVRPAWDRYFTQPPQPARPADDSRRNEPWDSETAERVVDCLYRFLHALERRDLDGAMACVAGNYHAMENDAEVTRDGLRQRIEALFDQWGSDGVTVTLSEIPDPIFHPAGVLVHVTIQVDYTTLRHGRLRTDLFGRVLLFVEHANHDWALGGIAVAD